jgi:DNA repair exonuclease SbcCD ATPase subunit
VCGKCGAAREHKSDGKLHLALSDRSGAAEDLGGLAFQLAAARWLRSRRGSPWSVVVLDEPFGALDEHNRRALATSLTGLIGDGFEQAFVVAHDRRTLDAMPNRILVRAHAKHSTVELA